MRIAISGHRGLSPDTCRWVDAAIRAELADLGADGLVGISCLADGADQIFARAVVDHGGVLEVVVAAAEYRQGLPATCLAEYDGLLRAASTVHRLDRTVPDVEAYMAASVEMLRGADRLVAVWDGKPARGYGGTADVVSFARGSGVPVTVLWPDGCVRD